jgi:hypothetical protein
MINGEKEFTKGGNPKPPPITEYLNWVVIAWDQLSTDIIARSFKICGITNAADGSEDDLIHCFNPEGPVPTGRELLRKARIADTQQLAEIFEEIDLDEDLNNEFVDDEPLIFDD